MSAGDDSDLERGDDDTLAAEYVLGVLPPQERLEAASRIESDPVFARLVDAWEMRLAPLADAYEEVEPPQAAKRRLDEMLFADSATGTRTQRPGLWNSLGFWRGLAAAAAVALLAVAALAYLVPPAAERPARLVASLAHDDTDVHYFVIYDAGTGEVALSHVTGARAEGHDFELWVLEGEGAPPVSLGVIPVGANVQLEVNPATSPPIGTDAVFAISLEPAGGSPTGQPTGPVVAAGDLKSI